jgi:hypothetical protein
LRKVWGLHRVLRFPPPIKLTAVILLKVVLFANLSFNWFTQNFSLWIGRSIKYLIDLTHFDHVSSSTSPLIIHVLEYYWTESIIISKVWLRLICCCSLNFNLWETSFQRLSWLIIFRSPIKHVQVGYRWEENRNNHTFMFFEVFLIWS